MENFVKKIFDVAKMNDATVMNNALALQSLLQEENYFNEKEKHEQEMYLSFLKEVLEARGLLNKSYYKL